MRELPRASPEGRGRRDEVPRTLDDVRGEVQAHRARVPRAPPSGGRSGNHSRRSRRMHLPEPIPTSVHDETFAGVTYHIRGELVPELQIEIAGRPVFFEHHVLLWKETGLDIELKKLPGAIKRKIAGLEFFVTRTSGSGRIAFSSDSPGQCVRLH